LSAVRTQIYLPDELAEKMKAANILNVSSICQTALKIELKRLKRLAQLEKDFHDVQVATDNADGSYRGTVEFIGKLLVSDDNDTDVYFTGRHRLALVGPWNQGDRVLRDYDTWQDAIAEGEDEMLLSRASEELGVPRVVRLDI
jgi:post-segregation antitoxin (ccd killing protein)